MELKSKLLQCTEEYTGTSKFAFWRNLHIGDVLQITLQLKKQGRGFRGGLFATEIRVVNKTQDTSFKDSITKIQNYLSKIDFIEFELN